MIRPLIRGLEQSWLACLALALSVATAGPLACGPCERAPDGTRPGWRLPGADVAEPVPDWSFSDAVGEVAFETQAPWGRHSVTIWCATLNGRLFIATDSRKEKRWVKGLESNPDARIAIDGRVYPVRAERVEDPEVWASVVDAYARKYRDQLGNYAFPVRDDVGSGHIFELRSRSP
jgi:hypothetical protein